MRQVWVIYDREIMLIYFFLILVVPALMYLADNNGSSDVLRRCFLFLAFAAMVTVPTLRDSKVGTDSPAYVRYFYETTSFLEAATRTFGDKQLEYGFSILTWMAHIFSDQYWALFMVIALAAVACSQWAILAYSRNTAISFFVSLTMGMYTMFFNTARQGIACAICTLAIGPLIKRNFPKYVIIVLVAALFHNRQIA